MKSRGLRLFDVISEGGDAIGAVYDALPKDIRKKWDKKQTRASKFSENWGQFGFGGADYKLKALYYNWDKVDLPKAIQNLVSNEIEDRIIGKTAGMGRGAAFGVSEVFRGAKRAETAEKNTTYQDD